MSQELENEFIQLRTENAQMRRAIENVEINIYWKDKQGRYLGMNKSNAKSLGITDINSVIGKTELELLSDKKIAQKILNNDLKVIQNKTSQSFVEQYPTGIDGKYKLVCSKKSCLRDEWDDVIGIVGVSVDL